MISLFLCNAMQSVCTFCTCHLQTDRSASSIPPPLFTVGVVAKQTAQRACTPQHLTKTHLRCEWGIWGYRTCNVGRMRALQKSQLCKLPLWKCIVALRWRTPTQGCAGLCWLSLWHRQHSASCPGKSNLWLKEKRAARLWAHGLELLFLRSM